MSSLLQEYLEANNLLSSLQFGFKSRKGAGHAVANITESVYKVLDNNKKCATVYLDLAKAFNTVNHKILLSKLKNIGINEIALKLITSYLYSCSQYVKIKNTLNSKELI